MTNKYNRSLLRATKRWLVLFEVWNMAKEIPIESLEDDCQDVKLLESRYRYYTDKDLEDMEKVLHALQIQIYSERRRRAK